jgi:thiosulfate/3-mercaptopyruvate sulfurtransferase
MIFLQETPMIPTPLINAETLQAHLAGAAPLVLLDCGFDLSDPTAGQRAFVAGHLPGAAYAHLDRDLAGPKNGRNGRHPLPTREAWGSTLGRWGIAPGVAVVAYDDQGGVYAARAWWMLRWAGHAEAAVLDGGRGAWLAAGGALVQGDLPRRAAGAHYPVAAWPAMAAVDTPALQQRLADVAVLDARAPERFRGEVEPFDPVAGRIPGARNRFFKLNLGEDGRFKPAAVLRAEFEALLGGREAVHQCGSGVTACHNLLAMAVAGLDTGALYPGSWSEWCSDPARPVARGD